MSSTTADLPPVSLELTRLIGTMSQRLGPASGLIGCALPHDHQP